MSTPDSAPRAHFIDLEPSEESFLEAILAGLAAEPKHLPAKFFYDEEGSRLFEKIARLREYYPTRTEIALLRKIAPVLRDRLPDGTQLVEFGSGSNDKVRILLEDVGRFDSYVPIDISGDYLRVQADEIAAEFPQITVTAICADYTMNFDLPAHASDLPEARLGFFPGSTIGNMERQEAVSFLSRAGEILGRGAGFLIGADLKKDADILNAAYNDPEGVTAAFNLNLLRRINRELGADFNLDAFEHEAFYNHGEGRVEMHLVSRQDQSVSIDGRKIRFFEGECIHTENSHKFTVEEFKALGRAAGMKPEMHWIDEGELFSVHLFRIP